jgi:hypothetical protein
MSLSGMGNVGNNRRFFLGHYYTHMATDMLFLTKHQLRVHYVLSIIYSHLNGSSDPSLGMLTNLRGIGSAAIQT